MAAHIQSGLATGSEGLVCFVCDVGVVGRYYTLATCRTQTTKVRLIEKLGQLVGEDYMVIISEEDVICRGCATMINSLDRLEKEVGSLRSIVLRYLEKKYDMEDGELVNTRTNPAPPPAPPPPPPPKQSVKDSTSKLDSLAPFNVRKRKFIEEATEEYRETLAKSKGCSWMQCNRCKYMTPASAPSEDKSAKKDDPKQLAIVVDHIPVNHTDDKVNGEALNIETPKEILQSIKNALEPKKEAEEVVPPSPQTVNISTSQITEDQFVDASTVNADGTSGIEIVPAGRQVTLQAVEAEDGTNTICMVDENGIIVQEVEQAEDGAFYVQMADGTDATKQVLSVGEDGSVQMVGVLWDGMVTADDGTTMVTF